MGGVGGGGGLRDAGKVVGRGNPRGAGSQWIVRKGPSAIKALAYLIVSKFTPARWEGA